jgi:hypothetical protein
MKNITITLSCLLLLVMFACKNDNKTEEQATPATDTTSKVSKEESPTPTPPPPMDSAAMQKAWEAYMTPGDMHKWLASMDGKWEAEMTFWMGPGAPPSPPSKATVENKTVLGGRYQTSHYKGKMMGMDFEGHGTMAYDNAKKKFINTWIDNTGTGLMYMEGPYDEASKTITMTGKMVDPATGEETQMRQVLKTLDDKSQVLEMYNTKGGQEYKGMEIKLTKK